MFRTGARSGWLGRALRAAGALPPADWTVVLSAMVLLPAAALALRLLPLPRVLGLVHVLATPRRRPAGRATALRAGHLVRLASRCCLPRPTCLARALVAYALLRRQGLAVEIVIGVSGAEGALRAHAWVEDGRGPLAGGQAAGHYAPLVRLGDGPTMPSGGSTAERAA